MNNTLLTVELDKHRNLYNVSEHKHNHYEVIYYISGDGEVEIDGKNVNFTSNTFSFIRPNYKHKEHSINNVSLIYVGFTLHEGKDIDIKNGLYKCPNNVKILNILKEIKLEKTSASFYSEERLSCLIDELIILIKRAIKLNKDKSSEMDNIKKYIYTNSNKNISGIDVAKHFNYNYDHFRKMFKEYFRVSISEYIAKVKVTNGLNLLKKTDLSVLEISKKTGFSSPSHFISLFKRFYKITPKQFLLNYDKNAELK